MALIGAAAVIATAAVTGIFGLIGGGQPQAGPTSQTATSPVGRASSGTSPTSPAAEPTDPNLLNNMAGKTFKGTVHQEGLNDYAVTVVFLAQLRSAGAPGTLIGKSS
ncbi:hypothetical protein [Pseudofrankia inefficax]|uniref:hypothetical protein n=1 Tax=Pseudofrankia inefficax (strain DSM 45817 / CECT 9037 / DDB 130130 / EuI1c) TaxID=298654 RepID=UPI0012FE1CCD|nr:hypothetical protein [Pseudofrankia inefficax]